MGGAQAARVLSTVRGGFETDARAGCLRGPDPRRVRPPGVAVLLTARLWDDGVIDPLDTRRVLAMGIAAALNAEIGETRFGVFRM